MSPRDSKVAFLPGARRRLSTGSPVAPTVGRVVHYGKSAMAALIVGVARDHRVHLKVWGTDGLSEFSVRSVPYSSAPAGHCWTWPPQPTPRPEALAETDQPPADDPGEVVSALGPEGLRALAAYLTAEADRISTSDAAEIGDPAP